MKKLSSLLNQLSAKQLIVYSAVILSCIVSVVFVYHNESFYDKPIAEITKTTLTDTADVTDSHNNEDRLYTQHIEAEMKNGANKGETITITNEYSQSGAHDQKYTAGDEVFVHIDDEQTNGHLTGAIQNVKRDKYLLPVLWLFFFILLIIGKRQGMLAFISLLVNAVLLSFALDIYVKYAEVSLLLVCGIAAVLFTVISLLLVNGMNEKTYAAIITTLLGTFLSLLIAFVVLWLTSDEGIRYEAMNFLTRPYRVVFMAGLFIGSLGAVMDVAITMASSVFELYEKDHTISNKTLKDSGLGIGKDIMGTMTSILFFAYISGSIPMLVVYLDNGTSLNFALSMGLSMELARALAGGIGIVLAIPIGLYVSIFFVNRKRVKS